MFLRYLFFALVAVLAVVVLFPRPAADDAAEGGTAPLAGLAAPTSGASAAIMAAAPAGGWPEDDTRLVRQQDGHFYADVLVDDYPVRMMVDTGASVIALTGADAEALGLSWSDSDIRPVAQGASGPVYGLPATIDRMQVGRHEARQVAAMIIPEGLAISLLGQSFLGRIGRVEIAGGEMILSD